MRPYEMKAQYYETDQMGIIHHSNYIRWFESARIDLLEQLGLPYRKMEEDGILIPVLSVSCDYRKMTRFDDTVCISVKITKYNGVRLQLAYEVREKESGELRATGETGHCFLDRKLRPVFLKKSAPELHEKFLAASEAE